MSIIGSNILAGAAGSGVSAYEIEQSLRFAGGSSDYFSRSVSGLTTQGGISFWIKFHRNFPTVFGEDPIFAINTGFSFARNYDARWYYRPNSSGGGDTSWDYRKARDESAWYHVFLKFNSASSTSLYLNGVLVDTQAYSITTSGGTFWIGRDNGGSYYAQYYLAEFHAAFGESLDATDFGEFDDNGVWRPIKFTGSYGSDGFYLKFDPSAANGLGHDHSGNGNNFTSGGGFSTSGTGTDVMSDTPTTNYCTWNPVSKAYWQPSFTEGNLKISGGAAPNAAVGTIGVSSGKWYWEALNVYGGSGNNDGYVGIAGDNHSFTSNSPETLAATIFYYRDGRKRVDGTFSSYGASVGNTDVIGVALDIDGGTITFYKNNTSQGSITLSSSTLNGKTIFPYCVRESGSVEINCGQRAFAYTPPTGFKALNTSNLPEPDIADGSEYFNTVLWTGDGVSGRAITGVGFQPDFLWIKRRNVAVSHYLQNSVTGATNYMFSDDTVQERNLDDSVDSFDTDGFTLGNDGGTNGSGGTYVGWNWLAGGSGSSNTDGSITSTVSANPSAGFSIVSYTGTGANATVGHGLGVAPDLLILKNRDDGLQDWPVYHSALGATKQLVLSSTAAASTNSVYWNNTEPTSTVFTVGTAGNTNGSGDKTIAYCFAEVEGYSKFGSYTGNGSSDGAFVYLGFKPSWLLMKNISTSHWLMLDVTRGQYYNPIGYKNATRESLYANSAVAESGTGLGFEVDFLSNGFKCRASVSGELNVSGATYIYAAFAENPFGGSGVSPATAR